jgi:hypothetical protein
VPTRRRRQPWKWFTLTRLGRIVTIVLVPVVVAAVIVGSFALDNLINGCGSGGIYHRGADGECTGVTDGSFVFASQLASVEAAIQEQDNSLGSGPHVTVALLLPMTDPDPAMQTEIVHAVQGAYAAQYRADHDGLAPPIRLVLANPGVNSADYLPVVQQLATMTGAPDNLRAVVGIGVSIEATKLEVGWLTGHQIPVVGGAITADDLANVPGTDEPFPGLARVEPTNSQVADALAHYGGVNPAQALLVEDTRSGDDYITTLAKAFTTVMADSPYQPYQFISPPDESSNGDTSNTFLRMAPTICATHAKWIYFAGRQVQLRQFINELAANCQGRDFTILTGSAASHLSTDPQLDRAAFSRGITLEYAAIASPGAWTGPNDPATGGSATAYNAFLSWLGQAAKAHPIGPAGDFDDGQTIINYDAAWTAITGINDAATGQTPVPSLQEIGTGWRLLSGAETVQGASGWICLDNSGNPYDKAIPIVRFNAAGAPVFQSLAWPAGKPPGSTCVVPKNG